MTEKQPKALRLADTFDHPLPPDWSDMQAASSELRRLHTENRALNHKLTDYASTVEHLLHCSHEDGAEILRLREDNEALRKCAVKYLKWLNIKDPKKSLESDLSDPEMLS